MSNLNSFAELIRKGKEDAALKAKQESVRREAEVAPLLSELFKTVSKAKLIEEKRATVLDKVDQLEASQITQDDVTDIVSEKLDKVSTDTEKKLLAVVKKLQDDISALKRHVDSSRSVSGWGSTGGGEVKILRMDDIDLSNIGDGKVLMYDAAKNKMVFATIQSTPSIPADSVTVDTELVTVNSETVTATLNNETTLTDEEMPFSKRVDFISDSELYKGEAPVGSLESSPVWRIRKVILGSDGDMTEIWASGNASYDKRYTDRTTYSYS